MSVTRLISPIHRRLPTARAAKTIAMLQAPAPSRHRASDCLQILIPEHHYSRREWEPRYDQGCDCSGPEERLTSAKRNNNRGTPFSPTAQETSKAARMDIVVAATRSIAP